MRPRLDGFLGVTDDDWEWTFTVDFMAAVRTTRAALPHLLATGAGRIVTVSSVAARLPDPLVIDYGAAKAALTNFCKARFNEVGPRGVRVNTIGPGPVDTALWQGADGVAAAVGQCRGVAPQDVATPGSVKMTWSTAYWSAVVAWSPQAVTSSGRPPVSTVAGARPMAKRTSSASSSLPSSGESATGPVAFGRPSAVTRTPVRTSTPVLVRPRA
ncbi:SDR family NAD(P)-dependent oxidoreductase [Streptomyces canus]|uniref:SDR family NAD(P)-dependent oxidoreductase n=1 Tax=Streptomyces canus TaxID=58343 RepID=UPI0036ABE624